MERESDGGVLYLFCSGLSCDGKGGKGLFRRV